MSHNVTRHNTVLHGGVWLRVLQCQVPVLLWQDVLVGVLFLGYGISLWVRDVIVMRLIRQIIVVDRCGGTASAKQLLPGSESLG